MINSLLPLRGMGVRAVLAVLPSVIKSNIENDFYRIYVTDCLKFISDKVTKPGELIIGKRFYDIVNKKETIKNVNAVEVVNDIINRAGLEVIV